MSVQDAGELDICGESMNVDMENLVDLDAFSEGSILYHVKRRFDNQLIYTYVGNILVAVNPFQMLDIYSPKVMDFYRHNVNNADLPAPHVFATAAVAYENLATNRENQSVLISGESGAGKTETTKLVLKYLARVAGASRSGQLGIEEQILQSNPVLEAFGNAKTLRNNNSSRFGKWMQVSFSAANKIIGCRVVNYLLEKSRVVVQTPHERNYHIFYMLMAGVGEGLRRQLALGSDLNAFDYLRKSGCTHVDGIDDLQDWRSMLKALGDLQFAEQEQNDMFAILATVLHVGNVQFQPGDTEDSSRVADVSQEALRTASQILGVAEVALERALTTKTAQMGRGSMVTVRLRPKQAADTRDAMSKAFYGRMFDYIIRKVNVTLAGSDVTGANHIGVLDIFGFEVFEQNSFEQLCINYANEKLQFHFNQCIFESEIQLYRSEEVPYEDINFRDNQECLDLIEAKPISILLLLDEECALGSGNDDSYAGKMAQNFAQPGSRTQNDFYVQNKLNPSVFGIRHFAGAVTYTVHGFVEKNKDVLSETLQQCARQSSIALVRDELFRKDDGEGAGREHTASRGKKKVIKTLSRQFRDQLGALMGSLADTEPHFIRCIKPNSDKAPMTFEGALSLRQLKYAGLFEAIRIRRAGYSYRIPHSIFLNRHAFTVPDVAKRLRNAPMRQRCDALMERLTTENVIQREGWEIGRTKVFLRSTADRTGIEQNRMAKAAQFVILVQSMVRGFLSRKSTFKDRYEFMEKQRKQKAEVEKRVRAVVRIQSQLRGRQARIEFKAQEDVVRLRRAVAGRDEEAIMDALISLEGQHTGTIAREKREAERVLKELAAEAELLDQLLDALEDHDPDMVEKLLRRADRIGMRGHPDVKAAEQQLDELYEKHEVMRAMVAFLEDDSQNSASILDIIEDARRLDIDVQLVTQVQKVYDSVAPKLEARDSLRRGIETANRRAIEASTAKVAELAREYGEFCPQELKAARNMLKMMDFERELTGTNYTRRQSVVNLSQEEGDRDHVTPQLFKICEEISAAAGDDQAVRAAKTKLRDHVKRSGGTGAELDRVQRNFKWIKLYATWNHPAGGHRAVNNQATRVKLPTRRTGYGPPQQSHFRGGRHPHHTEEDDDYDEAHCFFGFKPAAARRTMYTLDPDQGTFNRQLERVQAQNRRRNRNAETERQWQEQHQPEPRWNNDSMDMIRTGRQRKPKREPRPRTPTEEEKRLQESRRAVQAKRNALNTTNQKFVAERKVNWHV